MAKGDNATEILGCHGGGSIRAGPGAGDGTLIDGAAWTGAGDTGRGGCK